MKAKVGVLHHVISFNHAKHIGKSIKGSVIQNGKVETLHIQERSLISKFEVLDSF